MDAYNDVLYKNAKYFKENILPYTFIIVTKKGHIVVRSSESDFYHLVGGQHSTNSEVLRKSQKAFYKDVLAHKIKYVNLLNTADINNLNKNQNYIHLKNTIFISVFDSFSNQIKMKQFDKKRNLNAKTFFTDYYHYDKIHNNLNEIAKLNILGIIGQTSNSYFCFNSIMQLISKQKIESYLKEQDVDVFDAFSIPNNEFDEYLKLNKSKILISTHSLFRNEKKKARHSKKILSNKEIAKINKNLHKSLFIKCGMYGKNSIQLFKNNSIIKTDLQHQIYGLKTLEEIIKYINETYK